MHAFNRNCLGRCVSTEDGAHYVTKSSLAGLFSRVPCRMKEAVGNYYDGPGNLWALLREEIRMALSRDAT
jgi:hypothetical protein